MWNQKPKPTFRFEIDNFSEKGYSAIASPTYVIDGCEWDLYVWKGNPLASKNLLVNLYVPNHKSLGTGWRRTCSFYYVALNESGKELHRSSVDVRVFRDKNPGYGFQNSVHVPKFSEKELENDKLIIEVYIKLVEAFDGEVGDVTKKEEIVNINGFLVLASQAIQVRKIFAEHPHIALNFKSKNHVVKTEYMNVLLGLIDTLNKPRHSLSRMEICNAHSNLRELMDVGFKLEWLKTKLGEGSLESKKSDDHDESRVQQLEERVKNLELMDIGSLKSKLELAQVDDSRVEQLEESVKHLELIVSDLKAELDKEKAKSSDCGFLLVD
ncbi:unnamed protein product [Microthlaspi erraticum]|uniref:MATH domain-containing protein n=1 Tax=Microthlaspi erraticum TaxID=1685480 RepID=A0A6D2JB26_9BRAS|nr:unnamed protein product [Microthlaspi erraticum]